MPKKLLSEKEIQMLSKNPYVKAVSSTNISYTDEFRKLFIVELNNGKVPRQIFEENGFKVEMIGLHRIHKATARWRKAFDEHGVVGLEDGRKHSGRKASKKLSAEEEIVKLNARIKLLEAENELLKKLNLMERGLKMEK